LGGKQLGFADYEQSTAKKQTKREKFLSEMEVVVPWQVLMALIEPHYPKTSKKGWPASLSPCHHAAYSPAAAIVFAERSSYGRGPD